MNALPPLPPVVPIPPEPGEFGRVRRRALMRRLRVPAAAAVSGALVAVALTTVPVSQSSSSSLVPTDQEPSLVETYTPTASPEASASTSPSPSPSPKPTAAPSPEDPVAPSEVPVPPTTSPSPSPTYTDQRDICKAGGPRNTGPDITGVVVDRHGNPVPNITITGSECRGEYLASQLAVAKTDAQGRFRFTCVDSWAVAAPYRWYFNEWSTTAPVGYALFEKEQYAPVPCGSTHRIVLPDASTIRVQLVDENGAPLRVDGARVCVGTDQDEVTCFLSTKTDADGVATLTHLAPGRFWLHTYDGSDATFGWASVKEGETADTTLRYGAGKPSPSPSATSTPSPGPTP